MYAPANESNNHYNNDRMSGELSDPYAVKEDHYVELALRQWKCCPSEVASEFFSVSNIKRIQRQIKREVLKRSYGKFRLSEDQKVLDLLICMIEIYNLYAKDLNFSIIRQVK